MTSGHSGERDLAVSHSEQRQHLPVDPDVDVPALAGAPALSRMITVIFLGGVVGGLVRYEVVTTWKPATGAFPWSTFAVNTAGAFVLALLVVLVAEVLPPTRYLRPLIGTGFCGALTTFSSVAVAVDELAAHHHVGTAVGYLLASLAAGGVGALLGLAIGRRVPSRRADADPAAA